MVYVRRTTCLEEYLQTLALQVGGEKVASLLQLLNIDIISANTLLYISRKIALPPTNTPKIVAIDGRAIRRQTYVTILVDGPKRGLSSGPETRRPIDLLPDAKLETVKRWLKEHPGIEIISRDRNTIFTKAARKGAPTAIQVADLWRIRCKPRFRVVITKLRRCIETYA